VAIVVLGADRHGEFARGDLLMFVASLIWALYTVYMRKSMPRDASGTANILRRTHGGGAPKTERYAQGWHQGICFGCAPFGSQRSQGLRNFAAMDAVASGAAVLPQLVRT